MLLSTARDLSQVPTMCLSLALRCAFLRHSSVLGRKKRKFHVHGMPNTLEPGDFVFCPKCPCVNAARSATAAASAGVAAATVTLALCSTIAVRGYVKGSWLHRRRGRQLQVPAVLDSNGARLARVSPVRTRSSPSSECCQDETLGGAHMSVERFNGSFWMLAHVRRRFDLLLNLLFLVATSIWMTAQDVAHSPLKVVENFARSGHRSIFVRQLPRGILHYASPNS